MAVVRMLKAQAEAEDGLASQEVNTIGLEFAARELPDFEVVVVIHLDTGHLHNHMSKWLYNLNVQMNRFKKIVICNPIDFKNILC